MELDNYKEQLIKIKTTKSVLAGKVIIWLFAVVLAAVLLFMALRITPFLMLLSVGVLFLAFKLCATMNIEYEYLCVNGSFDIDKIINKSARKNVISFNLKDVESIEKVNGEEAGRQGLKVYQCTDDLENAWVFQVKAGEKGICKVIISPYDEMKTLMKRFIAPSVKQLFR